MKIPIPLMILKLYWGKNMFTLMVVVICCMNAEVVTSFVGMCDTVCVVISCQMLCNCNQLLLHV